MLESRVKFSVGATLFFLIAFFLSVTYIHYDLLMTSQKVAPRKHTCVLPKKSCLFGVSSRFYANRQRCVFPACYLLTNTVGSTQEAHSKPHENSHHFVYSSRKHTGSTHVCFLCATFCYIINGA